MCSNLPLTRQQCQTLEYATIVCQLYHEMFPNQNSWRFEVRIILSIMDQQLGPDIPSATRRVNDNFLDESGLADEVVRLIDSIRDRERLLEYQWPSELQECETIPQAIQWLHRPRLLETLVLIRTFVTLAERVYFPSIWRRLWAGNVDLLHMNILRILQPQGPNTDGHRNNSNEERERLPSTGSRSSGNDHDVRMAEEPDPFDILGSILYPEAFDKRNPAKTISIRVNMMTTSRGSMRSARVETTRGRSEHRSTSNNRSASNDRSSSVHRSTSRHRSTSGDRSTFGNKSTSSHGSIAFHRPLPIRLRRSSPLNPNAGSLVEDRTPIRRHSRYREESGGRSEQLTQQREARMQWLIKMFDRAREERRRRSESEDQERDKTQ